ncbi:hypothetical protein AGMMS49938_02580 [Fibrobacterales bacterium]|nr:hypothetical protein AGMMS49938_02580 [Fibrobacterales bacterium]
MKFGATKPPKRAFLRTNNSNTGKSDRYCIHRTDCHYYEKSYISGNTFNIETDTTDELEKYLEKQPKLSGGIQKCGTCLKNENEIKKFLSSLSANDIKKLLNI